MTGTNRPRPKASFIVARFTRRAGLVAKSNTSVHRSFGDRRIRFDIELKTPFRKSPSPQHLSMLRARQPTSLAATQTRLSPAYASSRHAPLNESCNITDTPAYPTSLSNFRICEYAGNTAYRIQSRRTCARHDSESPAIPHHCLRNDENLPPSDTSRERLLLVRSRARDQTQLVRSPLRRQRHRHLYHPYNDCIHGVSECICLLGLDRTDAVPREGPRHIHDRGAFNRSKTRDCAKSRNSRNIPNQPAITPRPLLRDSRGSCETTLFFWTRTRPDLTTKARFREHGAYRSLDCGVDSEVGGR